MFQTTNQYISSYSHSCWFIAYQSLLTITITIITKLWFLVGVFNIRGMGLPLIQAPSQGAQRI